MTEPVDWLMYLAQVHKRRPDKQPSHLLPRGCFRRLSGIRWIVGAEILTCDMIPMHPIDLDRVTDTKCETDFGVPMYRVFDSISRTRHALRMVSVYRRYRNAPQEERT